MFNPSTSSPAYHLQMIQPCPMAPAAFGYPVQRQQSYVQPQQQRIAPRSPAAPIIVPSSHAAVYPEQQQQQQQAYGAQLCLHCRARTVKPSRIQRDAGLCKHCKKDVPAYYSGYYRQTPQLVQQQPPIHHTLQNATITYDSMVSQQQRELVKDVFFSPALSSTFDAAAAAAAAAAAVTSMQSSESSQASDSDSDSSIATPLDYLSPRLSPADFLLGGEQEEALFGFDIENALKDSTPENVGLGITIKKKPVLSLLNNDAFKLNKKRSFMDRLATSVGDLPTPPATTDFSYDNFVESPKRRKLDSTGHRTPPATPSDELNTAHEELFQDFEDNYFEGDASAEESEEDDDDEEEQTSTLVAASPRLHQDIFDDYGDNGYLSPSNTLFDDSDDDAYTSEESADEREANDSDFNDTEVKQHHVAAIPDTQPVVQTEATSQQQQQQTTRTDLTAPRPTENPTIFQKLTKANVDWCRYCGTTEGVNWRPGPWGKRTLCNKHGCDYKGYGFACKLPRLDLTGFLHENIHDRDRPVLQLFCSCCQQQESYIGNVMVRCEGCPKAVHQQCGNMSDDFVNSSEAWYCDDACKENSKKKRIVVELPRKRLPLMNAPAGRASAAAAAAAAAAAK